MLSALVRVNGMLFWGGDRLIAAINSDGNGINKGKQSGASCQPFVIAAVGS